MEVIAGFPCKFCRGTDFKVEKTYLYFSVDFGVIVVEETTKYYCENCGSLMFHQFKHWEQKE